MIARSSGTTFTGGTMRLLLGAVLLATLAWGAGCADEIGMVEVSAPVDEEVVQCKNCKAELPYTVLCQNDRLCRECDECFITCSRCRGEVQGARICPRDGRCHRCDRCVR